MGVTQAQFLKWVKEDEEHEQLQINGSGLKGFPVMQAAFSNALTKPKLVKTEDKPLEAVRKKRKTISQEERYAVISALLEGKTRSEVAQLFEISLSTVDNIKINYNSSNKELKSVITLPQGFSVKMDEPVIDLENSNHQKIYGQKDIGVFFEDDFVVIRLPRKQFTKELLKGLV
jgi:transposase-like protein